MIDIKTNSSKNIVEIVSSGFLDVSNMHTIREELDRAIVSDDNVLLIIKDVDIIDMSFLQTLHAFLKKLKKEKKNISIEWDIDEENFRVIDYSGFVADFAKISNS